MLRKPFDGDFPITQRFGENPQDYPVTKGHSGVDWGLPLGTPIHSSSGGVVTHSEWNMQGYGNLVVIDTGELEVFYAHLNVIFVDKGQTVSVGTPIAKSGSTGRSTGPHLHFEVRIENKPVDPLQLMTSAVSTNPTITWKIGQIAVVNVGSLNIRSGAGILFSDIGDLSAGYRIKVAEISGRWVRIQGEQSAWVCSDYLRKE